MEKKIQKKSNFKKTSQHAHKWLKMMNYNKRFTDIAGR